MNPDDIKISRITGAKPLRASAGFYAVCWIKNEVEGIEIDRVLHHNVANAVFFFNPVFDWKIIK
jgi:AraC family transcriptional regulator, transcriptional activator of pobA